MWALWHVTELFMLGEKKDIKLSAPLRYQDLKIPLHPSAAPSHLFSAPLSIQLTLNLLSLLTLSNCNSLGGLPVCACVCTCPCMHTLSVSIEERACAGVMLCAFPRSPSPPGWIKLLLCLFKASRKDSFKGQKLDLIAPESEGENTFLLVGLTRIDIIGSLTWSLTRGGVFLNPLEHCVSSPRRCTSSLPSVPSCYSHAAKLFD